MKLISMTDFVLQKSKNTPNEDYHEVNERFVNSVITYANFLKQPLTLGMFVPCGDDGSILEPYVGGMRPEDERRLKKYSDAKSKVIFPKFSVQKYLKEEYGNISAVLSYKTCYVGVSFNDSKMILNDTFKNETIEDLIPYNLDLAVDF